VSCHLPFEASSRIFDLRARNFDDVTGAAGSY
jgi:hypothetical protein